jgi:preprotein translocase subunit SecF
MKYQNVKNKRQQKQPLSSKIAIAVMLAVVLAAVAKFTPVLKLVGLTAEEKQAAGAVDLKLKRKDFAQDAMREQVEAQAKAKAEREAVQKAMEEADRQRSHSEEVIRKAAEEAAFSSWYKPPKECINKSGKWEVSVKCGNDYIEAKKKYMQEQQAKH